MRRRWLTVGGVVSTLALILVGIRFIAYPNFIGAPDAVHIVVNEIQQPSHHTTAIFDRQVSSQASAIYNQLASGSPLNGVVSCPSSSGTQPFYHYTLTFTHWGITTATATSDAIDCMSITVRYRFGNVATF